MAILAYLTRLTNQPINQPLPTVGIASTHLCSKPGPSGTFMPNFSEIGSEMAILAHLTKLTESVND